MRLIILGAGGYGRTIADLAEQSEKYDEIQFLDDNSNLDCVIGTIGELEEYIDDHTAFYPAIGNNELRCQLINRIQDNGGTVASIIHSSAYISPKAHIGAGVAVLPNASIGTRVEVGDGVIINIGAIVDHDCKLSPRVHIAPGAIVKGENKIPEYVKIESGTVVERGQYQ